MSLIGVQSQSGVIQDAGKLLARKPAAWMLLGNALSLDFAKRIRSESPSTVIPIRAQADNWSLDAGVVDFAKRSMAVAEPFQRAGVCDFLLPPNEPVVQNDVNARRLNEQMVQIAEIYKANGYATGAYNFSVGNPDYPLWQYLNDGILASGGWLFLHEYGSPSLQNDSTNLSLRHRKARTLLSASVQSVLKIGVTECFIDLGATGGAGGYRNLPNPKDDELWWIWNLTTQLDWWDGELAKDDYVNWTCGYGYAMQEPWVSLGFDIANVDTDRAYFINWLKAGTTPIPPPNPDPEPPTMTTPEKRSADAFRAANVAYNKDAALFKYAQAHGLGYPVTNEYDAVYDGVPWVNQGYAGAVVACVVGDYGNVHAYDWLTGLPYVAPSPNPDPTPSNPQNCPAVIAANGAVCELINPHRQFVLAGASVKQGVSAFAVVTVIGENGVPVVGARVINIFRNSDNGEMVFTDGSGVARFQFGASSAFTVPGFGPFTFAVSANGFKTQDPPTLHQGQIISDLVRSVGDWQGEHTEWSLQFVEVA